MPKIRKQVTGSFTITSNKLVRDPTLNFKDRGLFEYLWSQKDGWHYYEREIVKHTTDGITAVRSGLDDLEKHGYLRRTRERVNGKLGGAIWILSENGDLNKSDKPILENLKQENLIQGNQTLRNTNNNKHQPKETLTNNINEQSSSKKDKGKDDIPYKEIIAYLNQKTGRNYHYQTKAYQTLIRARWKEGNTLKDFKTVIDNKAYDWQGTKYFAYMRPSTLFQPTKFDEYLNENNQNKPTNNGGGYKNANNIGEDIPDDKLPF